MRDELLKQATRIVIKIGSSLVASRETGLAQNRSTGSRMKSRPSGRADEKS